MNIKDILYKDATSEEPVAERLQAWQYTQFTLFSLYDPDAIRELNNAARTAHGLCEIATNLPNRVNSILCQYYNEAEEGGFERLSKLEDELVDVFLSTINKLRDSNVPRFEPRPGLIFRDASTNKRLLVLQYVLKARVVIAAYETGEMTGMIWNSRTHTPASPEEVEEFLRHSGIEKD